MKARNSTGVYMEDKNQWPQKSQSRRNGDEKDKYRELALVDRFQASLEELPIVDDNMMAAKNAGLSATCETAMKDSL